MTKPLTRARACGYVPEPTKRAALVITQSMLRCEEARRGRLATLAGASQVEADWCVGLRRRAT